MKNCTVLFTNAMNLGFPTGTFDFVLCGFMGWYDCFDFIQNKFTQLDSKAPEIHRVLRDGGKFVCCSWEAQEDLAWMEEAILRHYPEILQDSEYLERRPIGMAYEKVIGYEIIMKSAGFHDFKVSTEMAEFVSTDEEEWWQQMLSVGWDSLIEKIKQSNPVRLQQIKEAVFNDLQVRKQGDGIHFTKTVFYVSCTK